MYTCTIRTVLYETTSLTGYYSFSLVNLTITFHTHKISASEVPSQDLYITLTPENLLGVLMGNIYLKNRKYVETFPGNALSFKIKTTKQKI